MVSFSMPGTRNASACRRGGLMVIDRDRRHRSARRKLQPYRGAGGIRDLAFAGDADPLDAGGSAELQRHLHRAGRVGRPIPDLAGAEIQETAPIVGRVVTAEGAHGRGAQPRRPIERAGHGFLRRRLLQTNRRCAGNGADVRFGDVANRSAPEDLRGHAIALVRESLVAHLRRDLVFGGGLLEQAGLPRRARQRLFTVDVLAHLHTGERDRGVHEIRDADGHGVDIPALAIQQPRDSPCTWAAFRICRN